VLDARFAGSCSLISVSGSFGARFLLNEGASFMGPGGMVSFEERAAIHSVFGAAAAGHAGSAVARCEGSDETILGTAS